MLTKFKLFVLNESFERYFKTNILIFLREKIRCWALASSGYLPVTFFDGTGNAVVTKMDSMDKIKYNKFNISAP